MAAGNTAGRSQGRSDRRRMRRWLLLLFALSSAALLLVWIGGSDSSGDLHTKPVLIPVATRPAVLLTQGDGHQPRMDSAEQESTDASSDGKREEATETDAGVGPVTGGSGGDLNPGVTAIPMAGGKAGDCLPRYSSVRCIDEGSNTFYGTENLYGFPIYNRTCLYEQIVFDHSIGKFVFYRHPKDTKLKLQPVSLSSRAFDLPAVNKGKRSRVRRKMMFSHVWTPELRVGPIPCTIEEDSRHLAYYSPIVAPWNYAHTLFCDLFGLFWAMWEFGLVAVDWQVVAVGRHYHKDFPLPDPKYKAFGLFSRRPPVYESSGKRGLPTAVYSKLLCGIGTKTWSWVTTDYKASGSPDIWFAFRRHLINVTGAEDHSVPSEMSYAQSMNQRVPRVAEGKRRRPRVSICHKKDKRGIVNYEETVDVLTKAFPEAEFVLEGAVGRSPKEQVQMMLDADVYMCNEGTLGTTFFMMPPGSAFVSVPLVYHGPHLHQKFGHPEAWWKLPDMMRPDPRKNSGGNIDWFPPAIPWVKAFYYDYLPLNETKIQLPLGALRNYMPDYNIQIQAKRIVPLMAQALKWVQGLEHSTPPSPNYSINGELCRQLLQLTPSLARSFNSGKCYYGMSWLCELWTNTVPRWRFLHGKWQVSKGHCGDDRSYPPYMNLTDPRDQRPMSEFLFYTREELAKSYTTTDFGSQLKATDEELDLAFPPEQKKGSIG